MVRATDIRNDLFPNNRLQERTAHFSGTSFRLFLLLKVLHGLALDELNVPFWASAAIALVGIWLYTKKSGIKTIIYTDTGNTITRYCGLGLYWWFCSNDDARRSAWRLVTTTGAKINYLGFIRHFQECGWPKRPNKVCHEQLIDFPFEIQLVTELTVLVLVLDTVGMLGDMIHRMSNTSRIVDKLLEKGLVERVLCPRLIRPCKKLLGTTRPLIAHFPKIV